MTTLDPSASRRERLHAIDLLRGIVMVLMALDHARDYFGDFTADPTALATTTPALFFTRWVTHFCAPVFVFLAGTSAWLWGSRRTKGELARFLLSRGIWLVVLEFTVLHFAWMQSFDPPLWFVQVIAAIGMSMLALAGLVYLPTPVIAVVATAFVAGHNLLDPIEASDFGSWSTLWMVVHEGGFLPLWDGKFLMIVYPLLPWIGVMALGYLFGAWMQLERAQRRVRTLRVGAALCVLFVVLRWSNVYGDPGPWESGESATWTLISFLNCEKYPPSLLYLAMTLGPALLLLAALDREPRGERPGAIAAMFITFGRVPLFYYLLHLLVLHTSSRVFYWWRHDEAFRVLNDGLGLLFTGQPLPEWYGYPLAAVYLSWALTIAALYPVCRWYAGLKSRGRSRLWSYL